MITTTNLSGKVGQAPTEPVVGGNLRIACDGKQVR